MMEQESLRRLGFQESPEAVVVAPRCEIVLVREGLAFSLQKSTYRLSKPLSTTLMYKRLAYI